MFMRHKWLDVSWARCVLRDMRWRFTLSYRDVEDLLAERALDVSYETVRCW
jgi:transposase-like protein